MPEFIRVGHIRVPELIRVGHIRVPELIRVGHIRVLIRSVHIRVPKLIKVKYLIAKQSKSFINLEAFFLTFLNHFLKSTLRKLIDQ